MPTLRPRKRQSEAPTAARPSSLSSTVTATAPISTAVPTSSSTARKRATRSTKHENEMTPPDEEHHPLLDDASAAQDDVQAPAASLSWAQRNQWIVFALASGACAAFNGVFAKLTTTDLTTNLSLAIARMLGLESVEDIIEYIVRGSFFGLNLVFNGVMWTLFTTALARGNSTTQVSIMNTSANFVITAILGFAIFSEALPPLWWLGAAMLVAGNVIIGRKDEGGAPKEGGEEVVGAGEGAEGITLASGSGEGEGLSPLRSRGGVLVDVGSGDEEEEEEEKSEDEDVADLRL